MQFFPVQSVGKLHDRVDPSCSEYEERPDVDPENVSEHLGRLGATRAAAPGQQMGHRRMAQRGLSSQFAFRETALSDELIECLAVA